MRQLSKYTIADSIYLLILAVASISVFGSHGVVMFLCLATAYTIPACILRRSAISSAMSNISLLSAGVIMSLLILLNYYFYCYSMGSIESPYLTNTDMNKYWNIGIALSSGADVMHIPHLGYAGFPLLVSLLFRILGTDLIYPMTMNMFFILMSIVCIGLIVKYLFEDDKYRIIAGYAIAISCAVCYYVYLGTVILKDAPICFGISLSTLAIVKVMRHEMSVRGVVLMIIGFLLLATTRTPMLCFLVLLVLLMIHKRDSKTMRKATVIIILLAVFIGLGFYHGTVDTVKVMKMVNDVNSNSYFQLDSAQAPYLSIVGGYVEQPVWYKLLVLPFAMAVQIFIPLPLNFTDYADMGVSLIYAKIAYPWYAVVGLYLYYFLFLSYRKPYNNGYVTRLAFFALGAFALVAYMFAGTVSRYFLPFVPLVTITAAYALYQVVHYKELRHKFIIFASIYSAAIVAVVAVAMYIYSR